MENNEFSKMAQISKDLEPYYRVDNDTWADSPFEWIKKMPTPGEKGVAGARMVIQWLNANNFPASATKNADSNLSIHGKAIALKFATLSEKGKYIFNQIRDQEYDFLMCIGVMPRDAHGWIAPKRRINNGDFPTKERDSIRGQYSFGLQHGGDDGDGNTWQLSLTPPFHPPWMRPQKGNPGEMLAELKKLTGK